MKRAAHCATFAFTLTACLATTASAQVGTETGACCYPAPDGSVLCETIPRALCDERDGNYFGDGSSCAEVFCGVPTGACCFPTPNGGVDCQNISRFLCDQRDGSYLGNGVDCALVDCGPPTGACCIGYHPDDPRDHAPFCEIRSRFECENDFGAYLGNGTSCADDPCIIGACCFYDTTLPYPPCLNTIGDICDRLGGDYHGDGSTCATVFCAPPPLGACCLGYHPDDPRDWAPHCEMRTREDCVTDFGAYLGDGTDCDTAECITGACCFTEYFGIPPRGCLETLEDICTSIGGEYQGDGTTCEDQPCPTAPTGACCRGYHPADLREWVPHCVELTEKACVSDLGVYLGDGTTCDTTECITGACCFDDIGLPWPSCVHTIGSLCKDLGGRYQGDGTSCADVQCAPTGACCFRNHGIPVDCLELTENDCRAAGADYQGDGTACTPDLCTPLGACCFEDFGPAVCVELTGAQCHAEGGDFQGEFTTCVFDGCLCPCETDGLPGVTILDLFVFLVWYFTDDPRADFNGDGTITPLDILAYLGCWFPALEGDCRF